MDDLVTAGWLEDRLGQPGLVIVDATWHLPSEGRDAYSEFMQGHIPGARFLDIEILSDRASGVPHMLPAPDQFGEVMAAIGIDRRDHIIVYDDSSLRTAARGWFMLRHFGADRVSILDGGLAGWTAADRALEVGEPSPRDASFLSDPRDDVVTMHDVVISNMPIIDARSSKRFEGIEPEPREGVAPGHIPGSRNLPYTELYREDGTMKSKEELSALFSARGIDPSRPFIATCGSGVTANSLIFAAMQLGHPTGMLYDGSWSEWGSNAETPKESGSAKD